MVMLARGRTGHHSICANFLAFTNFVLFVIMTSLAAYLFDSWSTGKGSTGLIFASVAGGFGLLATLVCGAVGLATTCLGFMHIGFWNEGSRNSALGANVVTLALVYLSAGLSSRALRSQVQDNGTGHWKKTYSTMLAFNIILMLTELLYVIHLATFRHDHAAVVTNNQTGVLPTHQKVVHEGNHMTAPNGTIDSTRV